MIYTIEAKAIVKEHIERGAVIRKSRGGVVYLSVGEAKEALRAQRGVVRLMTGGLHGMLSLDAEVYRVDAEEKGTTIEGAAGERRLKLDAEIMEVEG
jgi:hypothetical protein